MKKRSSLFLTLLLMSLSISACSQSPIYINDDEKVVISVAKDDECYTVESLNPLEVDKGDTASFKLSFKGDYDFHSSSNGYLDDDYNLVIDNVKYSETIYIESVHVVYVSIFVGDNSHFTVNSPNPMKVIKGNDAIFDITFDEGYVFDYATRGSYENGKFTIPSVENDFEAYIKAKAIKPSDTSHIKLIFDSSLGDVKVNGQSTSECDVSTIEKTTIEAIPYLDNKFVCLSLDGYISSKQPFSYERVFEYQFTSDLEIYVNFWDDNKNTIIYSANGGSTISGDEEIYYPHTKSNHLRMNTIQGTNAFYRSGYFLDSWNTKSDGSGERIGVGSRFKIIDENTPQTLYAIWVKEIEHNYFTYEFNENDFTYSVVDCTYNGDTLAIPEKYRGLYVSKIKQGALKSLNFTSLYLPQYLDSVESGAVVNCDNFTNLHFYDYLSVIPDDFYIGKKPSYLYINANTDPCFVGSYQNGFVRKTDLLLECDSEKIVFVGNSNTMYSIDGKMVSEHFNKDVVCYGTQIHIGVAWELACLRSLFKDDNNIIVFCGEFDAFGVGYFFQQKYYAAESNYDLLLALDLNELPYYGVYSTYTSYRAAKKVSPITPYTNLDYECDNYGCLKMTYDDKKDDDWAAFIADINLNFYSNGGFDWIPTYCQNMNNSSFYVSCAVFNRNSIAEEIRDIFYSDYQQSIIDHSPYPVISKLIDYSYPGSAFYTDNYHTVYEYTIIRTNSLISDLEPYIL